MNRPAARPAAVSVVIPAYNAAHLLGAALLSVRAQTLAPLEVIVTDDGSTDDTAAVAERAGARVLRQGRRGVSAARNAAVEAAVGEWIAFLDADDLWEPDKLAAQFAAAACHPAAGLVFTDFSQVTDDAVLVPSVFARRPNYAAVRREPLGPATVRCEGGSLLAGLHAGDFIHLSSVLVRRAVAIEAGLFDPDLRHGEDLEFLLRVLPRTDALAVERPLTRRRLHPANASADETAMAVGVVGVADRVAARPPRYAPATVEHFRRERALLLRRAGTRLLEAGRHQEAAAALGRSLRAAPRPGTLRLWLRARLRRSP